MASDELVAHGAREHSVQGVTGRLPRYSLVCITGLSGSGKSSLAVDTIYAEGQRRYVESLSDYARQFLEQMEKPDVDLIDGLSPAISIEQKTTGSNPRSTVGTVTEIYDYLRLLFANIGVPHCHLCGREIASQSLERIIDMVMLSPNDERINVLAPVVRGRKGEFKKELAALRARGFSFNAPHGACQECQGLGAVYDFDPARLVPDDSLSLTDGAIAPWARGDKKLVREALTGLSKFFGIDLAVPFRRLSKKARDILFYGAKKENGGERPSKEAGRTAKTRQTDPFGAGFEGLVPHLRRRYDEGSWVEEE